MVKHWSFSEKLSWGFPVRVLLTMILTAPAWGGQAGTQKWACPLSYNGIYYMIGDSSPAIGRDGTIYVGSRDGKLCALFPNGKIKWAYPVGAVIDSSPAIGPDGTIYVGAGDGNLYAFFPNGAKKWDTLTGGGVSSPAIAKDGTIVIGGGGGNVYAIRPDKTVKWTFHTEGSVSSSPAIGPDGTVYIGSDDCKLYAIYNDSGPLAQTAWPMFHHDLRHTGRLPSSCSWLLMLLGY